jgi:hypothetical protein
VPVLVVPESSLLNARRVVDYYDEFTTRTSHQWRLYPDDPHERVEARRLFDLFYDRLGTAIRDWAYAYMLPRHHNTARLWMTGTSLVECLVVRATYPVLTAMTHRSLRLSSDTIPRRLAEIEAIFDQVEAILSIDGAFCWESISP